MKNYCVAIHVPVYVDGGRVLVASEWQRALILLRDSFAEHFDRFILVAPRRPVLGTDRDLVPLGLEDGFDVRPSISREGGKASYWLRERRQWRSDVASALAEAEIAHVGPGDLYRPINFDATWLALKNPATCIFIHDTDTVTQMRNLIASGQMRGGPDRKVYERLYDHAMRDAVRRADLALLKGRDLFERYCAVAREAHVFHDTSYSEAEIVPRSTVERRVAALRDPRPLKLVYCGRLVARKGVDHAITVVGRAVERGADVTLDVIGDGNARGDLVALVERERLQDRVTFLGSRPYGATLISELAGYDALFFTPTAEDTPRMIFDGYAAGLPLVAYDIPYVRERATEERAVVTIPAGDRGAGAGCLVDLDERRDRLTELALRAHEAAYENAAEAWYHRRAAWTLEAHDRRKAGA